MNHESTPSAAQPQYSEQFPMQTNSKLALFSVILGIISIVFIFCMGGITGLVALILGILAISKISKSQGLLKGKGMAIAGIILGAISTVFTAVGLFLAVNPEHAPLTAFDHAKTSVLSEKDGVAYGNTEEAKNIAGEIASSLKSVRKVAISGEDSEASLSGGNFITFVQLNEDSAAVMIHVPDLRKYDSDAKSFIAQTAWTFAQGFLSTNGLPEGSELVLGTKGMLLFDKIYKGKVTSGDEELDFSTMKGTEADLKALFPAARPEAPALLEETVIIEEPVVTE